MGWKYWLSNSCEFFDYFEHLTGVSQADLLLEIVMFDLPNCVIVMPGTIFKDLVVYSESSSYPFPFICPFSTTSIEYGGIKPWLRFQARGTFSADWCMFVE